MLGPAVKKAKEFLWKCYEGGWRSLFRAYFAVVHRISIEGLDRVPTAFDRLIVIANHASYLDGLIVWTYLKLPFRIVVDRAIASSPWLAPLLRNRYIVPIDFMNPYALKEVVRMVSDGLPLLVFPEGRRTSTGHIMKIYDGTGFVAHKTGASILPVYLRNTYNTFFARRHGGRRLFAAIGVTIGRIQPPMGLEHLPSKKRKGAATRMIQDMLGELYLEAHNRPTTLGSEFVRICRKSGGKTVFDDSTGAKTSYRKALLNAFAIGRFLVTRDTGNIGIMLPNLSATAIVFMGMEIFRKAPVFLNYSSGSQALRLAMEQADIGTIITSRQFLRRIRMSDAIFGARRCIFLEDLKKEIGLPARLGALFRVLCPGQFGKARPGEEKETAVILFTSGSEGTPKGVCLSHENIITNVYQGLSRIDVTPRDTFLNVLPMFHAFGLTVGTIIPVFARAKVFFHVSPLQYRIVSELAYDKECSILLATNTFLHGYGRRANPYDFHSLRYIFCGGEPLADAVFQQYATRFGIRVMTGYGATECAPLVSVTSALRYEHGTAGAILPGVDYKLAAEEGIDDKGGTVGRLLVRGKNVMKGYLDSLAASCGSPAEDGGWYDTGDVVEMTAEASLKVVGRLKRFAKISGEMISLTAVEEALSREITGRSEVAIVAVSDEEKGERLVAVTNSAALNRASLRDSLKRQGLPDLAVPRSVLFMKDIPKLSTGKIDYAQLGKMISPS
jgi:acyl-[acyl-carrier-protein]-phospholipid O-acyltransferase/long-chain-fatty-acid--[acyl-carrier-protein] ligase